MLVKCMLFFALPHTGIHFEMSIIKRVNLINSRFWTYLSGLEFLSFVPGVRWAERPPCLPPTVLYVK